MDTSLLMTSLLKYVISGNSFINLISEKSFEEWTSLKQLEKCSQYVLLIDTCHLFEQKFIS